MKISRPPPASRHPPPRSPTPGIGRRSPSTGGAHRCWIPWRWPPDPPLIPRAVASSTLPYCTTMCSGASCLMISMSPSCYIEGTMDKGGFPPLVSPRCPRRAGTRSAPVLPSASPPVHYNLQLGRTLVMLYQEAPSYKSWDRRPRINFWPPAPAPLSPRRARFGSAPLVTHLPIPSHTPGWYEV